MPIVSFDMTNDNYKTRRFEFRGRNNVDYYAGDLESLSDQAIDVRIEKNNIGDFPIYLMRSSSDVAFRRAYCHIRADKANITTFWFVRKGHLSITSSHGRQVIRPGECVVTQSTRPYYLEAKTDDGAFEGLHLVVPTHRLQSVLGDLTHFGQPFSTSCGEFALAERILSLLFERDDLRDQAMAQELIYPSLIGLSKAIANLSGHQVQARDSITDRRLADIQSCIKKNFANPDLNAKRVASSCGISLRYLCAILKSHSLSFSDLLWDRRMEAVLNWLRDRRMDNYSICQIAYMAGYKSSAHFHRVFKARVGVTAMTFRNNRPNMN